MQTINIPVIADGVKAVTVGRWLKKAGEAVKAGEAFVELEIEDKLIHLEAKQDGKLMDTLVPAGKTLVIGSPLANFEQGQNTMAPPSGGVAPKAAAPILLLQQLQHPSPPADRSFPY